MSFAGAFARPSRYNSTGRAAFTGAGSMQPNPTDPLEPPAPVPVSPELLAWAQQTLDVEAFLQEVREIEATGGYSFESIIAEVEAVVRSAGRGGTSHTGDS